MVIGNMQLALGFSILLSAIAGSKALIPATFIHGVASGDPLPTGIVLWTRVSPRLLITSITPLHQFPSYNVTWSIYPDATLSGRPVLSGVYNATVDHDWTVKVFVDGLTPAKEYWYNFVINNGSEISPTGHFKLPPPAGSPLDSLKFFFFSCSNYPTGYFNAYDIASKYQLDFWMHLGDYYYDYGLSDGTADVRWEAPPANGLQPIGDIQTLADYRARHGTYRKDPGLQALTASAALISIWDDHEFMNNVWSGGAQNQYPQEVEFYQRKMNALRAYTEWMPIRWNMTDNPALNVPGIYAINRTFEFGDLATLFMLEDRVTVRTQAGQDSNEFDPTEITDPDVAVKALLPNLPPSEWNSSVEQAILNLSTQYNIKRTNKSDLMIGPGQNAWVQANTQRSAQAGVTWQLYAEGTVMQDWFSPDFEGALNQQRAANSAVQSYWQEVYDNLTTGPVPGQPNATYQTWSTVPQNLINYAKVQNVSASVLASARTDVALGRYVLNNDFDSWQGYLWDRYYFLGNISAANNPTVYSGDSHDFWTGYLTYVSPDEYVLNGTNVPTAPIAATEFDGGSVTSNGGGSGTTWPLDFTNAAWLAANPNMVHVEVRYKGGIYVQLNSTNQHVEHIHVDTISTQNYHAFCGAAFDVPARANGSGEIVINPGQCGPVPGSAPYASTGTILQNQFNVSTIPKTILAGTAMPMDPFLVSA